MTSNDIYTPFISDQYCVYHTIYSGSLMPANYIGSTNVDNVLINNYHGSVASKRYKAIWDSEIKLHPELFSTDIVSYHDTRSNATHKELQVQKLFNVVKSDLFVNRSYAKLNGFQDITYTPEEKAATSKKKSDSAIIARAKITPEERAATNKKISETKSNKSPEEKLATSKNLSDGWANRTPGEKAATVKKMTDASLLARAYKTPEQKVAAKQKKVDTWGNRTPEQKVTSLQKRLETLARNKLKQPISLPK